LAQTFSFNWPLAQDWPRLRRALSGMLAPALRIESIEAAPEGFHARKDAKSKRYAYTMALTRHPDPFMDRYAWTLPELDVDVLNTLTQRVCGRHDFAGFCCAGSSVQDTRRTIYSIELHKGCVIGPMDAANCFHLVFHGDGFLYKMVRNLVGTFADIARGQLDDSVLDERLSDSGPYRGFTAPAKGLVLIEVKYE
jgi:tRNA pseudouridine38-40 synthase